MSIKRSRSVLDVVETSSTVVYISEDYILDAYVWAADDRDELRRYGKRKMVSVAPGHGVWILYYCGDDIYRESVCISDFLTDQSIPLASPYWREIVQAIAQSLDFRPGTLEAAVEDAVCDILPNPDLTAGCRAGIGPFTGLGEISCEEFYRIQNEISAARRQTEANSLAKQEAMKRRRAQFAAVRDTQILALLNSGVPYRCRYPGCEETYGLTVDHIRALSLGGSDDLRNLQFMCRSHNSQKGTGT